MKLALNRLFRACIYPVNEKSISAVAITQYADVDVVYNKKLRGREQNEMKGNLA